MKLHPNIRLLTWFNFFTDFKLYAPIAVIYFAKVSGSYAQGMAIFSIAMISAAVFEIPTGIFSDKIGRKKTVILGALCAVLYTTLYALGFSFWFLAVGALFEGLSIAFYSGNNDALLHDTLSSTYEEHRYDEYLGHVSKMFQIALAISAVFGSVLATFSFPLIMWLSVIPQLICFLISLKIIDISIYKREAGNIYNHLKEAVYYFIHNKKLRLLSISSIMTYGTGEVSYQFQSAFYISVIPLWLIGFVKMLSNVGATLSFHYSGRLIKKFEAIKILIWGNIYNRFISAFSVLLSTSVSPFLMTTSSLFFGVTTVASKTLMQKEFKTEQRATMASLNSLGGNLFFGVTAILVGVIADRVTPAIAILALQFLQLPKIWFYWKIYKMK